MTRNKLVLGLLPLAFASVVCAVAPTASALGTRNFNCNGVSSQGKTTSTDGSTLSGGCSTVRLNLHFSNGTWSGWGYGFSGAVLASSTNIVGGQHQGFNDLDQWVGTTT